MNPNILRGAAAGSLQSCPTLCDPIDGSPPGSYIHGILQARTLEWVAISFSNAWKWKVKVKSLSRVLLFVTPRIAAYQAPPSMAFSRQEHWSGLPMPSPKTVYIKCNFTFKKLGMTFKGNVVSKLNKFSLRRYFQSQGMDFIINCVMSCVVNEDPDVKTQF